MFREAASRSPEQPRELTPDMRADAEHAGKFLRMFGGLWLVIGALVGLALAVGLRSLTPLAGCGVFVIAGALLYALGVRQRRARLDLFRTGVEHDGRVESVLLDRNVRMNGRHPYRVRYRFLANGVEREGTDTFWTDEPPAVKAGERVAVLSGESGSVLFTRVNLEPSKARIAGESARIATDDANEAARSDDAPAREAQKRGLP